MRIIFFAAIFLFPPIFRTFFIRVRQEVFCQHIRAYHSCSENQPDFHPAQFPVQAIYAVNTKLLSRPIACRQKRRHRTYSPEVTSLREQSPGSSQAHLWHSYPIRRFVRITDNSWLVNTYLHIFSNFFSRLFPASIKALRLFPPGVFVTSPKPYSCGYSPQHCGLHNPRGTK